MLHLVRHGRPLVDPAVPAAQWGLDPAAHDDVRRLRSRLPTGARWVSSAEPKARATAALLVDGETDEEVGVEADLGEHRRRAGWVDDVEAAVARAFAAPDRAAAPGWEPLDRLADRVVPAVRRLLAEHVVTAPGRDLVIVGHGTAWTLVVAALTGAPPDLERWRCLAMPDVVAVVPVGLGEGPPRIPG